jgi:predicted MFS family arabinose efflux permease
LNRSLFYQILSFIATRLIFNTFHRMVYPFLPYFMRGLGVDLGQMSAALALRAAAGAFSPFLAVIADLRGRKAGMLLGTVFFIVGVTLVALQPVFWAFVAALFLATIGYLVFIPSMQAYLGDRVPYEKRGLPLALTELSWSLSFIIGVPLTGFLIAKFGWTSPFPWLAGLGLLALILLSRLLPADPPPAKHGANPWSSFRTVLVSPLALIGLAMGVAFTIANESVNLVFGVWMESSFGFKLTALGLVAVAIGLAEFCGELLAGGVVDRLGKVRAVALGLLANCAAALALAAFGTSLVGAVACLVLFYLTFEFTIVSSLPLMSEILPSARATLLAANMALISLGRAAGAWFAPRFFELGASQIILFNALAAVGFNLLALLALSFLRKVEKRET